MILLSAKAKTDFFFNIVSHSVHTLPPAMLESLDPCGIEVLILVPENTPTQQLSPPRLTGNASQLGGFSCSATENSLRELDPLNTEGGRKV